ncbi:hypothetical protein DJ010_17765 [Nocardioides silvaticus]|uniref:Uncharacterized protein n=1 Tax=Nocardioides silvaticus TaxID=2201891 RepID=A0A316TEA7_9ACTN|nr:hypothetical protein DJ010_17765 [Nocardioides silvaticus]
MLAFAVAIPIGCAIWAALRISDLGWLAILGLTMLFALGGVVAFRRPLPTVRRSEAEGIGITLAGFGAVSLLNRVGESYPLVGGAVMCGFALLLGWSSCSLFRISRAIRPGGALDPATFVTGAGSRPPSTRQ